MTTDDQTRQTPTDTQTQDGKPAPVLLIFLVIPLLGILAALLTVAADLREQRRSALPQSLDSPAQPVHYAAPDFSLQTLDGRRVSLADFRGKILFLNFWQTTCVPCITEMPEFMDFMADQNPDEVALLAVNFDETPGMIRDFFARHDIVGIPTALDPHSEVRRQYGVQGIPMTFVIGPQGLVRDRHIGGMTYADMEAYVNRVQADDTSVD